MKKTFLIITCLTFFAFACNSKKGQTEDNSDVQNTEESSTVQEDASMNHESMGETEGEMMHNEEKEHVCNDKCTAEKCHTVCGEKGHECAEACHKSS